MIFHWVWIIPIYYTQVKESWLVTFPWVAVHLRIRDLYEIFYHIACLLKNLSSRILFIVLVLYQPRGKLQNKTVGWCSKISNKNYLFGFRRVSIFDDRDYLDSINGQSFVLSCRPINSLKIRYNSVTDAICSVFET